ncbi:MAG: hypothetical protein HKN31_14045 [Pricia sp.]|nr:hypothetical protein [Pricia sp.]
MKKIIVLWCLAAVLCLASCNIGTKRNEDTNSDSEMMDSTSKKKNMAKAENLVIDAIKAHGGKQYDNAHYGFTFRKKDYTFLNNDSGFTYTVQHTKDGNEITDILVNGKFSRILNGDTVELSKKNIARYHEALNSVVYFVLLPYKLSDQAVNKTYLGQMSIKDQPYEMVGVTFDKEGGGEDYNDEFLYWINTETKTIDYLAYNYETSDGGVRFRSAYNPMTVGGIRFQDYVNYEAPIDTPLRNLPRLYEKGELKELSRIETRNIKDLYQ